MSRLTDNEGHGNVIEIQGNPAIGSNLFYVHNDNSGKASVLVSVAIAMTINLTSETGAKKGGGAGSNTWARHSLYVDGEVVDVKKGTAFNDWNGICTAVVALVPGKTYHLYANQDNGGCTVINTDLRGVIKSFD